jgi:hypothetical protein
MIIKYYTLNFPETLHILEDVTDVVVYENLYSQSSSQGEQPDTGLVTTHYQLDDGLSVAGADGKEILRAVQFIDFTRTGVRSRLWVYGRAYVCNSEGKTIEPVNPRNRQ